MAHNLASTNGKTAMMYVGEVPWHRLGTKLDAPGHRPRGNRSRRPRLRGPVDAHRHVTTASPSKAAGPLSAMTTRPYSVLSATATSPCKTVRRSVSLMPSSPTAAFATTRPGPSVSGEKIFLLAKLPESIRVKNSDDLVDKFLLLTNAHDGSAALRVFFTPIRVVCQNTLSMAERQGHGQGVSILHKGNLEGKILEAQRVLGLAQRFYDDAAHQIDRLASYYPSVTQLGAYFKSLYPDPEEDKNNSRAVRTREELHRLFEEGVGHDMPEIPPFGLDCVQRRHRAGRSPAVGQGTRRSTASQQPPPIDLVGQRRQTERAGLESRPGNGEQLKPFKNGVPSFPGGTPFTFIQTTNRLLRPPLVIRRAGSPVQFSTRTDDIAATHFGEHLFPQIETENETCGPNVWRVLPGVRESNRLRRIFLTASAR